MNSITSTSRAAWWWAQLGIGIVFGGGTLAWVLRGLDWRALRQTLGAAHYEWVALAVLCVIAVALVKAVRWHALFRATDQPAAFGDVLSALLIAQMINVLIPVRLGEILRIALMKQSGQSGATTLSTIAIEKALDLVAAGSIALTLVSLALAPEWLRQWTNSTLLFGVMLSSGLVLTWYARAWLATQCARLFAMGGCLPAQARGVRIVTRALEAFGALTHARALTQMIVWTTLAWFFSLAMMLILFTAFDLNAPFAAAIVLMLALTFSNIVPAPPGLIGVMHAIAVIVLGGYGISSSAALGFGIVLNVVAIAPLIVLGGLALGYRVHFSLQAARKLSRQWLP